jgi:hypothetical protein
MRLGPGDSRYTVRPTYRWHADLRFRQVRQARLVRFSFLSSFTGLDPFSFCGEPPSSSMAQYWNEAY